MHRWPMTSRFGVLVDENHDTLSALYRLPKHHKIQYGSLLILIIVLLILIIVRETTSELSIFSTYCLTTIKPCYKIL